MRLKSSALPLCQGLRGLIRMCFAFSAASASWKAPGEPVGEGVVGHDAFDRCAVRCHGRCRPGEESGARWTFLIGQDFGIGEAGVIIDGDMDVVEADLLGDLRWLARLCSGSTRQPPPSGMRPSFLTSTWIMSPGASHSFRRSVAREARIRAPVTGARSHNLGHAGTGQNPGDRPGAGATAQGQIRWAFAVLHTLGQDIGNDFCRSGMRA